MTDEIIKQMIDGLKLKHLVHINKLIDDKIKILRQNKINIIDVDFSCRAYNCLKAYDITTLDELTELTYNELLGYKNIGKTALKEIEGTLKEHGLNFKQPNY